MFQTIGYIYEKRQIDFLISICLVLLIFCCTEVQVLYEWDFCRLASIKLSFEIFP